MASATTDHSARRALVLAATASLLLACSGTEAPSAPVDRTVTLEDANNYRTVTNISIPTIETAPGADLDVCWSNVDADLLCHDVAPADDLDNIGLVRVYMTKAELEQRLTADDLPQSEVSGYLEYNTDHESTCVKLSSFSFRESVIDVTSEYVENDEQTYMLLFTTGLKAGLGARSMTVIKPTADSTNTTVNAQSGCGLLDFTANLHSAEPVRAPRTGPWPVNWENVTVNGQGDPLAWGNIDRVLIGFYAGMAVEDIEAGIFDLEQMATSLWEIPLKSGNDTDLALAQARDTGEAFPGFDRDESGVWLLALLCSSCQNPAPLLLSVLEPK